MLTCDPILLANVGTPFILGSMAHLAGGNMLLGGLEGNLIARWFGTSKLRSVCISMAANYFSAWCGGIPLCYFLANQDGITIVNIKTWFLGFVILAFLLTLLLELPFIWLILRPTRASFWRVLRATILIHTISYPLLFGWYWLVSDKSMLTRLETVPASKLDLPTDCSLFYVSSDGRQVIQCALDGSQGQVVAEVAILEKDGSLKVQTKPSGGYQLMYQSRREGHDKILIGDFSSSLPGKSPPSEGGGLLWGEIPSLSPNNKWRYLTGFWASYGLQRWQKGFKTEMYGMELPFASWYIRNAVHIQDDLVCFRLGDDQICALRFDRRQIALITRGRALLVVRRPQDLLPSESKTQ